MFREGLLPRRKTARVAAHLAHCPQCAGVDAQLADLPALLASAPAPPMPDALTDRIAAALAAEAAARSAVVPAGATAARAAADGDATPAQPDDAAAGARGRRAKRAARTPSGGRSRLALRIATAAAVIVVVAGGGYGVSRLFSSGAAPVTAGGPGAGPAAGHSASKAEMGPSQNGAARPGTKEHAAASGAGGYHIVRSGTDYRSGQLGAQVRAVLPRFGGPVAPHASATFNSPAPLTALSSCLAHVAGNQRPRLVDVARYNGKPATVIVLPAGANTLRVLVVGPGCSAAAKDLLASTTLHGAG